MFGIRIAQSRLVRSALFSGENPDAPDLSNDVDKVRLVVLPQYHSGEPVALGLDGAVKRPASEPQGRRSVIARERNGWNRDRISIGQKSTSLLPANDPILRD